MQHAERGDCPKGHYTPGLGDRIAAVTRRWGIAQFVDRLYADLRAVDVWGINPTCGCKARRAMLNRWWGKPT